ncbi:GTP-binding protein 2-like isoform X2 [Galleria mellonella]|nr:GTP-binding protein 2-like isoform X2 [Galleria mellonella]
MDSFCSLFDPSDGNQSKKKKQKPHQDSVKKKTEAPKGRRRGRKCQGKNETLPEESSFLCEPELSTELLVKDGSYIENFMEVNKNEDTKNTGADKKPNRRNSCRKSRRKKNKVSPAKELSANSAWDEEVTDKCLNNQSTKPKICDDNIGKNVNDLKFDDSRKNEMRYADEGELQDKEVYNVIDKLERIRIKDDLYLSGDFDPEDLDSDFFCSFDELDDSCDDTDSDADDSGDEVYGRLPPEPRFGNVEYKLQLVSPCERRFQHLVTQLKWRLRSGGGSAVYVVGVRDCGAVRGLRAGALRASLRALRSMAAALAARLASVALRRLAPRRALAAVCIRRLPDPQQSVELRVAVMGANEAGKSTLIGVLTQGELDNGRGSARLNMFRHLHEVKSGRTSSLSHEILGFDAQGNVVNYGCSELMTAERIGERSAKLVSFLDLAGHSKYQRTTLHGLSGYSPHYAMLVISATAGITRITEEHVGLLLALDLPFFVVITKCELASTVQALVARLATMIASANKKPVLITDESMARSCVAPGKLIRDSVDEFSSDMEINKATDNHQREAAAAAAAAAAEAEEMQTVGVFPVSCVRGAGLNVLHAHLLALQPPRAAPAARAEACEFQIDEIFHVDETSGPVVGGLLARGQILEGDHLVIGPMESGEFVATTVRSIYRNRVPCAGVRAGHCASLGLRPLSGGRPRPGHVLLAAPPPAAPAARPRAAAGCPRGRCKATIMENVKSNQSTKQENRKSVRRKNKNLLQDLIHVEHSLAKEIGNFEENIYKADAEDDGHPIMKSMKEDDARVPGDGGDASDQQSGDGASDEDDCICDDKVYLEDPNDPRGCIYFQATVRVLRHATAIARGFQGSVLVGSVRQTAAVEGILSANGQLRAGETASVLFRFVRCPEYLVRGRRLLFTAGLGTRAIGRITQVFPYIP